MSRVGVLFVGFSGSNATTFVDVANRIAANEFPDRYGITSMPEFDQSQFPRAEELVISGWDIRGNAFRRLEDGGPAKGFVSKFDSRLGDETTWKDIQTLAEAITEIREEIEAFKGRTGVAECIVVNCATPARRCDKPLATAQIEDLVSADPMNFPSGLAYMLAAIRSGSAFVDFTPSELLEIGGIEAHAAENGVQIAGRDGSTGQTWLKMIIASALLIRGMSLDAWYSTNVLGNRDGFALSKPEISETKLSDKKFGLLDLAEVDDSRHIVDINYLRHLGDIKESWDLVDFSDVFGNAGQLRINWRAQDSPLAVQVLFDIIRLLVAGGRNGKKGLRSDLGIFFKKPIGSDSTSPVLLYSALLTQNPYLLRDGEKRTLW